MKSNTFMQDSNPLLARGGRGSLLIVLTTLFLFSACSGNALIDATNSSLSGDLKTLHVHVLHHGTEVEEAFPDLTTDEGYREFTNDLGITVTLKKGGVSWGDVRISSDGSGEDCVPGVEFESSTAVIDNILDPDLEDLMIAGMSIADTDYCQFSLTMTTENELSDGIDTLPEIAGSAVYVSGSWNDGINSGDFEIHVGHDVTATFEIHPLEDDGTLADHAFHFHGDDNEAMLMLGTRYDQWFNGIDFTESAHDIEHEFMDNLEMSVGQHLEAH